MIFAKDLLKGRIALVTGGGTGIGMAIAAELAKSGADVAIASRNVERLNDAANVLRKHGPRILAVEANVRDPEAVSGMVERCEHELGGLDVLVNNAAGNFYAPSATLSPNGFRAVVETDLYGTFYCCQAAYPAMRRRGAGKIISISMTLHYRGWPLMAHATAAKAGVDALTRTLALEWAPDNITVNAVAPGPIPTEGVKAAFDVPRSGDQSTLPIEAMADHVPLKRLGKPEDIANMVAYLASPAADWITGSIFVVDGGTWLAP